MKNKLFLLLIILPFFSQAQSVENETITISGRVTDFEGISIDSAMVQLKHPDFSEAYATYTDINGNYKLSGVKKGKYMAMYVLRPKEYPRQNAVPPKDMRLEYWAWNVIADRDLTINPRYHRLELYGLTAFKVLGGGSGLWLFVRPMSLGKLLEYSSDIYLDKKKATKVSDISVYPEHFKAEVFIDDVPVKVKSIQKVEEFPRDNKAAPVIGYLINIASIKKTDNPYAIIRVTAENLELNEKGENIYFYEFEDYE